MSPNLFESHDFFIDEKIHFLQFENSYRIYNEKGENVGAVKQKLSAGQKFLRLVLSKAMLPFFLEIRDADDRQLVSISRGWTFFMSKITIKDSKGAVLGSINQKFNWLKPSFKIFDSSEVLIAEISGDWVGWNFLITDATNRQIGSISKKWAGALKEIFTTADKYNVKIDPSYPHTGNKIAILASAITIDMVLKESK